MYGTRRVNGQKSAKESPRTTKISDEQNKCSKSVVDIQPSPSKRNLRKAHITDAAVAKKGNPSANDVRPRTIRDYKGAKRIVNLVLASTANKTQETRQVAEVERD